MDIKEKKTIYKTGLVEIYTHHGYKYLVINGLIQLMLFDLSPFRYPMGERTFIEPIKLVKDKNISVLNVGLGGGFTLYELLEHKNINKIDVIELYQEVIDALVHFPTYKRIQNDNRVNIQKNDIRKFKTTVKYDIVVMDLCHPELEESDNIFTEDFFKHIKEDFLKEDGIFLLWFYAEHKKEQLENYLSILKTIYKNSIIYKTKDHFTEEATSFFCSDFFEYGKNLLSL